MTPKGSYTLQVSTVYSKARDPNAHQIKLQLHFNSSYELKAAAKFLECVAEMQQLD